jgi:hypothetical protein
MPIRPKTGFFIFLDEFSRLYRSEYDKYHVFTDAASKAWLKLDDATKENYNEMSRLELELYKNSN